MLQHMNKITLYAENGKWLDINCKDKSKDGHILLGLLTNNLKAITSIPPERFSVLDTVQNTKKQNNMDTP